MKKLIKLFQRGIEKIIPKGKYWYVKLIALYAIIWTLVTVFKGFLLYLQG